MPDIPEDRRILWLTEPHDTLGHSTESAIQRLMKEDNAVRWETMDSDKRTYGSI